MSENTGKVWNTYGYVRLSREDGDKEESSSVDRSIIVSLIERIYVFRGHRVEIVYLQYKWIKYIHRSKERGAV